MTPHAYALDLAWTGHRSGKLSAADLGESLTVATPPPFPKGQEGIWSPEHLFTAAVSSCLMTTFLAIAENSRLEVQAFDCRAEGVLDTVEGKYQMTEVRLFPRVQVQEADRDKALRVLQKAENACLITNSVKAAVHMTPEILTTVAALQG